MDYQNFKRELYATVLCREETAGKCVRLTDEELSIHWESDGKEGVMRWKLEELYDTFLESNWRGVMAEIIERLRVQYFLRKYPAVLRPLNYSQNRLELQDGIYWRFGDISLVLYAPLQESGEEGMMMQMSRENICKWRIEEKMLLEEALRITSTMRPPRLYRGTNIDRGQSTDRGIFMPGERGRKETFDNNERTGVRGYRLTALGYLNGAVAFFYPGVKERLAEIFEGDYYVGFISVHEAVLHPVRYKVVEEMKAAVMRANIFSEGREMLTNQIYRYCNNQKRLVEV